MDSYFSFDAAYLARLRARDDGTFTHFYEYFYIPIRNRVRRSVRSQDADDLVQDVFAAVIAQIDAGQPREPHKLPGYVFGICRNMTFQEWDQKAKHKGAAATVDFSKLADLQATIEARLIRSLDGDLVQFVLQRLANSYREVINREFVLEQDRQTAARAMDTTTNNYRLILCRALKRFREEWGKYSDNFPQHDETMETRKGQHL